MTGLHGHRARHELEYPAARASTATEMSSTEVLAIGSNGLRACSVPTGEQRACEAPQTNPIGVVHLGDGVVLTAGGSGTPRTGLPGTWDHHEVARLAVSPSVNELAQGPDGTICLACYYPPVSQG